MIPKQVSDLTRIPNSVGTATEEIIPLATLFSICANAQGQSSTVTTTASKIGLAPDPSPGLPIAMNTLSTTSVAKSVSRRLKRKPPTKAKSISSTAKA